MKKEEVNGNEDKNIEKLPLHLYKPQLIVDVVRQWDLKLIRKKDRIFFGYLWQLDTIKNNLKLTLLLRLRF